MSASMPTAGANSIQAPDPSSAQPSSSKQINSVSVTTASTSRSSNMSDPLPLASSLQSTFNLLIRRLGQLLAYQVQLRAKNAAVSPAQMQLMPGWMDLVAAAQRWQSDVRALHRWLLRAQDGLAIELTRARKREAIEAQEAAKRAAEEERERAAEAREAEADASKGQCEAAPTAPATDSDQTAARKSDGDPIIDLTAEGEDDDDSKPLKSRPSSGAKRQREEDDSGGDKQSTDATKDGAAGSGDGESAKRQKTEGQTMSSGTNSAGNPPEGQQGASQPDPAALLAALTGAAAGGPNAAQGGSAGSEAATNNGNVNNFDLNAVDLSNLDGLPDLSSVDFSAFMTADAGNTASSAPPADASGGQGEVVTNPGSGTAGVDTGSGGGDPPPAAPDTIEAVADNAQTAQEGGSSAPAQEQAQITDTNDASAQPGSEQASGGGVGVESSNAGDASALGNFSMGDDLSGMNINMSDFGNMNFSDMGMGMGMFGGGDGENGAGTGEGSGIENIDFGAALQGVDWSNLYNTLAGSGGLEGLGGGMGQGGGESGGG